MYKKSRHIPPFAPCLQTMHADRAPDTTDLKCLACPGPCLIHEAVWADAQEDEHEPQKSPVAVVKIYVPNTQRQRARPSA